MIYKTDSVSVFRSCFFGLRLCFPRLCFAFLCGLCGCLLEWQNKDGKKSSFKTRLFIGSTDIGTALLKSFDQVKTDLLLNAIMETEELGDTDEAFEAYIAKVSEDVKATPEQLREYFGEEFMKNEFRKELATNIMIDSAVVKSAEEAAKAE